jgi:membrane protease YdiL (CAAX protease family)
MVTPTDVRRPGNLFTDAESRPRRGWRLTLYLLAVLAAMAAADAFGGDAVGGRLVGHVAAAAFVVAVTFAFRRHVDRRPWSTIGLSGRWARRGLAGFVIGSVSLLTVFAVAAAAGWARVDGTEASERGLAAALCLVAAGFGMYAASAVIQEVAFRGYALQTLADNWPLRRAAVVSSLLFAALHLPGVPSVQFGAVLLIEVALMAGFFVLTRLSTGALWTAIGFHTAWNWWMDSVLSLDTDAGPDFGDSLVHVRLAAPGFGLGHGGGIELLYLINSTALFVGYWLITRRRGQHAR